MNHGEIKETTKFLFFPLVIDGVKKWWTRETYTKRYFHNVHDYMGEWKYLHWGKRKKKYIFNEFIIQVEI